MDTHPVPQNVTAFEFHLVGNMTMRQFGYLAAGLTLAYVVFILFASTIPYFAYPLIAIFAAMGAAYAFLPIMDRPLDHWTMAFIKAITKPTLRRYESTKLSSQDPKFKERLNIYLQQLQMTEDKKPKKPNSLSIRPIISDPQPSPQEPSDEVSKPEPELPKPAPTKEEKETLANTEEKIPSKTIQPPEKPENHDAVNVFLEGLHQLAKDQPAPAPPQPPTLPRVTQVNEPKSIAQLQTQPETVPNVNLLSTEELLQHPSPIPATQLPTKEDLDKTVQLARQAQTVQNQIIAAEKQIDTIKSGAASASVNPERYTQQFQSVLTTLQKLNQQAREISHNLAELSSTEKPNTLISEPAAKPNIIPTLTLTSVPNILNGIVTDSQGNYIEGAIIVAHDKQGLPVRALKTNKLGQFIAATPLSSGSYTISVEKDDLSFDVIQIELTDKVLNPVVISARKGGTQ